MFNKLSKGVKVLLGCVVIAGISCCCYLAYNADEKLVSRETDNFFYIYGVIDESNVVLLKPKNKLNEEELKLLGDSEDGLIMVDAVISEEAKQNYMPSSENIDVYGVGNTYIYEKGIGPFKHTYEKVMDVLYLTDNTAIKLGLKEGELNYIYVNEDGKVVDENGNIVRDESGNEIIAESMEDETTSEISENAESVSVEESIESTPEEISVSVATEADSTEEIDVKN